ncbi:MAG: glycosyltransferase family protein [Paracoccaceae bacterium]
MTHSSDNARVLMYSHDTFGLGHLRRCRTIAHSLVQEFRGLQVYIISGATIAGAFDYRSRVDFVKIPSVIKLRNGEYTSMKRHIDLGETLKMRSSIIRNAAESFQPDIFIVDKAPLGLKGEVEETLHYLKARGTRLVLGMRDVMDAPHLLDAEWKRNDVLRKVGQLYDDIWVYGPRDFYDPLIGLDVPPLVRAKMSFVGFLQRNVSPSEMPAVRPDNAYILVTTGGGGDGAELVHDVIAAYEADPGLIHPVLIVLGPYMSAKQRRKLMRKAERVPQARVIDFESRMEELVAGAAGVVAMGGYNTFCEILSFDRPALIVPRTTPREEQLIRARRASELGLVDMLLPEESAEPLRLAAALKALPGRPRPTEAGSGLRLDGLNHINEIVHGWLDVSEADQRSAANS